MRANEGTVVALDAVFGNPFGNVNCYTALFGCSSTLRECTVNIVFKCGNGELVAAHGVNRLNDLVNELNKVSSLACEFSLGSVGSYCLPCFGNFYLCERVSTCVDSGIVEVNHSLTLLDVGLVSHLLHVFDSFVLGKDVGECEECGLENSVLNLGVAYLLCSDSCSVDCIELDVVVSDVGLNCCGEMLFEFSLIP